MAPQPIQFANEGSGIEGADRGAHSERLAAKREDISVQNYDFQRGYDLAVTARNRTGAVVYENRCTVQPGQSRSIDNAISPGEYRIEVELEGSRRDATTCRIGDEPVDGVLVELGNGRVSVTGSPAV